MINLSITETGIKELIANKQVSAVIHGCNCFHGMNGPVAESLKDLTKDDIVLVDMDMSEYGDINKLGTWTNQSYTFDGHEVEIFNFYSHYTMPAAGCETIHWSSLHDGIIELLSSYESGQVIAVEHIGYSPQDRSEFSTMLNSIIKQNEDELPDIDIVIFDK